MSPEELQRRLRALPNGGELFVQRNREWAFKNRRHPDAYQVWDREVFSRRPYCVLSVEIDGRPAELDDRVVCVIATMLRAAERRRYRGWADEQARSHLERDDQVASGALAAAGERFKEDRDKAFHAFGWKRHWALDRCALPTSSTPSGTRSTTSRRRTTATRR